MGGIYGCGYQEVGVIRMYRCGCVKRYLDFLILIIPTRTCISCFLQQHLYFLVHF